MAASYTRNLSSPNMFSLQRRQTGISHPCSFFAAVVAIFRRGCCFWSQVASADGLGCVFTRGRLQCVDVSAAHLVFKAQRYFSVDTKWTDVVSALARTRAVGTKIYWDGMGMPVPGHGRGACANGMGRAAPTVSLAGSASPNRTGVSYRPLGKLGKF